MPAAINLGPLSLPLSVLVPMVAVFLGLWLGNRQVKRQGTAPVEPFFWRIVFWALAVARLAYVLRHHEAYLEDPWTALDVRDGGFDPWAGLVWAWLLAWRYGWRGSAPRRPLMATLYLLMALYIIITNISLIPHVFGQIFDSAFNFEAAGGGLLGGLISQTMMIGIKRGLYSNEAGQGSAPNAAAAAEVKHPVSQGMIQMLGVFVDTIIVCSCTAFIVLVYQQPYGDLSGAELTQAAIISQVGAWGADFLAIILFMFAFSTVIGNYAYAESNVQFIKSHWLLTALFRMMVLGWVYFGAVANVPLVWDMADMAMGTMAWINLVAILLLSPLAFLLLRDYTSKLKMGKDPVFKLSEHPGLKRKIKSDIW